MLYTEQHEYGDREMNKHNAEEMLDIAFETEDTAVRASTIGSNLIKSDIRVLIVDDEAMIRTGIRKILQEDTMINVIGEAGSGESSVDLARKLEPDVALMDISMPGYGGIEATRKILFQSKNTQVLALSVHSDEYYPSRILSAGASGYITKGVEASEMIAAIKSIYAGEKYISKDIAKKLRSRKVLGRDRLFDCLSPKEIKVCAELVSGRSLAELADRLDITLDTAKNIRASIFDKLDISNEVSLVHLAIKNGLLDKDEKYFN